MIGDDTEIKDFVGFARVFCGKVVPGQRLYICDGGENADASKGMISEEEGDGEKRSLVVSRVYKPMGRHMEPLEDGATSGMLCGIYFEPESNSQDFSTAEQYLTCSTHPDCPPFEDSYGAQAVAILHVSLEPVTVGDLDKLVRGLHLLRKGDPAVEIQVYPSGEYVMGCCGDEHLKRCVTDLTKVYAPDVAFKVSDPLVSARESLVSVGKVPTTVENVLPSYALLASDKLARANANLASGEEPENELWKDDAVEIASVSETPS